MGVTHTAAILSRLTEKDLFYHLRPRSEKLGSEARQVKQRYIGCFRNEETDTHQSKTNRQNIEHPTRNS